MSRELFLTIGKRSYSIKTPLDDDVLERVRDLIDDACGVPVRGVNQEDLLILTCLRLAYSLDNATMRLNKLLERLGAACGEPFSLPEGETEAEGELASPHRGGGERSEPEGSILKEDIVEHEQN